MSEYCKNCYELQEENEKLKEKLIERNKKCAWKSFEGTLCPEALEQLQAEREKVKTFENVLNDPEVRIALTDVRTGEREVWRKLGCKADRYKQALDEIEKFIIYEFLGQNEWVKTQILDIIRKAKGEENAG